MSRRSTNSDSSAIIAPLTNSIVGDGPRPPPRRRAASVTGQQSIIPSDNSNNVRHTRRSLSTAVSLNIVKVLQLLFLLRITHVVRLKRYLNYINKIFIEYIRSHNLKQN